MSTYGLGFYGTGSYADLTPAATYGQGLYGTGTYGQLRTTQQAPAHPPLGNKHMRGLHYSRHRPKTPLDSDSARDRRRRTQQVLILFKP